MSEWKPIESAPNELVVVGGWIGRDGKVIWIQEVVNPFYKLETEGGLFRKKKYEIKNIYINSSFSHWRPYPEPPEVAG